MNIRLAFIAAGAFALAACDSDNNNRNAPDPIGLAAIQVIHGSPDAPPVNVTANGNPVLTDFDFGDSSGLINLEAGTYTIAVDGILPGGTATVIGPVDLTFEEGQVYTIAALNSCGDAACSGIEAFVSTGVADVAVSAGSARLYVVHGVPGVEVDVYVTDPAAILANEAPTATFNYQDVIGPVEVPADNYRIRVTLAGDSDAVVFDSGEIALGDGTDLRLAAVPNVAGGPGALSLVGVSNAGPVQILDVNTPTAIRVGHLSPDTGAVDVLVDGATFLDNVTFPQVTGFTPLDPATYSVSVTDGEQTIIAIGPVDLTFEAATWYTILAVGEFAAIEPLIAIDDPRPLATSAKVRIIHAASADAADPVDIWVTEPGTTIAEVDPTLSAVPFKANTGYLALPAGTYEVNVAPAGTTNAVITRIIEIANGGVYTAIARDPEPESMDFGLIVLPDVIGD